MKKLLILACGLHFGLQAQINPSDGCAGVPSLPVNAACVPNTFTMAGSYSNGGLVMSATCISGLNQDDGWYSFTATSTSTTINLSGDRLKALVIWTACGGGTELACSEAVSGVTATLSLTTTIGTTYYIQVHRRGGGNTATMIGDICVFQTPVAAACVPNTVIASIPYTQTGMNTAGSGDDFSSADACGSVYMNGDDYTFSYTPAVDQCVSISLSNTATWVGLFVTNGCPSAGGVSCVASSTSSSGNPSVGGVSLTAGVTYFFTVSTWPSPQTTPFDISVTACPPPPANDECVTATPVPVNPTNICATSVAGTIFNASASWQANACGGTDDDDVWYSFVATNTTHLINLNNVAGSTTDLYHSVYAGTCGALGAALVCSDPNNSVVTGLIPGNTYYVRVYSWTSTPGQTSTFNICIATPPPPPANDNCAGAIPVPVNPTNICASTVTGTIYSATASSQANGCGGTADDDVWFSFVATNTSHLINLLNITGGTIDLYHSVYAGSCGAPGAALVCSDPNNSVVSGLTPGNTYYVRVYSWTSTAGQTSVFDVCIGTPPPPPANDNCSGAIPVPVSTTSCSYTTGTIYSATASSQANGCGGTADDDVWYSFVATSPAVNISLTNISGGTTDLYHSVYAGSCGAPGAALVCSDPNTSTVTGLTPGNTYFVRIYSWTSTAGQTSAFDLCILEAGACGTPNNQDYCVAPAILTPGTSFSSNTSGTYTSDIPANLGSVFCGSIENNSWYEFVATSTSHTFPIVSVTGCTWGIQAQVYAVTEDVNGCCTNFASVSNCYNPASLALGTVTATGLTIGNTYLLMVDGNGGSICDFTISGWNGTGILPVELINFTGLGMPEYNALNWSTASEKNNDHFNVLRSFDGLNFDKIGEIKGAGSTLTTHQYSFHDLDLRSGVSYYQLEQVDYDGASTRSDIIAVDRTSVRESIITVYPNPADQILHIEMLHELENGVIQLIDAQGSVLAEQGLDAQSGTHVQFDLHSVNAGFYLVRLIESDGAMTTKKIAKK